MPRPKSPSAKPSTSQFPPLSFRLTPPAVLLLEELKAHFGVSGREAIERALVDFHRVTLGGGKKSAKKSRERD